MEFGEELLGDTNFGRLPPIRRPRQARRRLTSPCRRPLPAKLLLDVFEGNAVWSIRGDQVGCLQFAFKRDACRRLRQPNDQPTDHAHRHRRAQPSDRLPSHVAQEEMTQHLQRRLR